MNLEQKFVKIALIIGYISCCFPASKFLTTKFKLADFLEFKFKFTSPTTIYSLTLGFLVFLIELVFEFPIEYNQTFTEQFIIVAEFIQSKILTVIIKCILIVHSCKKVIEILKIHRELSEDNYRGNQNTVSYRKRSRISPLILAALFANIFAIVRFAVISCGLLGEIIYVMESTAPPAPIISMGQSISGKVLIILLEMFKIVRIWLRLAMVIFLLNLVILFSQILIYHFRKFCFDIETEYFLPKNTRQDLQVHTDKQNSNLSKSSQVLIESSKTAWIPQNPTNSLDNFYKRSVKIRQLFKLYNESCGLFVLLLIVHHSSWFILCINKQFIQGDIFKGYSGATYISSYLGGIIQSVITLILVSHVGHYLIVNIDKAKENLADSYLSWKLTSSNVTITAFEKEIALINSFLKWKWKFKALNTFHIGYKLLTMVAGTIMTYTIFLLQFKIAST